MSRWKAILQAVTGGRSTRSAARDARRPLVAVDANYLNDERSASVRPAEIVSTGERVYLVNMDSRGAGGARDELQFLEEALEVKNLDQAHQFAQEYVATGESPDPDKTNSRQPEGGGPERSAFQTVSSTYYQSGTSNPFGRERSADIGELPNDRGYNVQMREPSGACYEVDRPTRRGAEDVVEKFLDTGKMPQDRQINPTDASLAAIYGARAVEEELIRVHREADLNAEKTSSHQPDRDDGPEIEVNMTGRDRFEYRQGERGAVVEMKPDAAVRTITMGDASNPNAHSVERDTLRDAADAARDYVSTGKPPAPTPERTRSPRPERDGGPER